MKKVCNYGVTLPTQEGWENYFRKCNEGDLRKGISYLKTRCTKTMLGRNIHSRTVCLRSGDHGKGAAGR